jgi:tetratricopeptide (TPR) repeat protein
MIRLVKGLLLVAVALAAGCRSVVLPPPPVEDVASDRRQRLAAAVAEFEQKRTFAELEAARAAWKRGDLRNSQAGLENLLRRDGRNRDARLLLARVHFEQNHPEDAMAQLQTALADFPNDPEVHHAMGVLLTELKRPEDARAHLDRAASLAAARNKPAGTSGTGSPGVDAGNAGGNSNSDPAAVDRLLRGGEAALAAGNREEALALFRRAEALDPQNPQIPTAAAVAALRQSCPEVAVTVAKDGVNRFPQWTPLLRTLGAAHYRVGDYHSSQLVLQQALSLDKSDSLAYFLQGCTCLKLRQIEAARACFAEAERINPSLATRNAADAHDRPR